MASPLNELRESPQKDVCLEAAFDFDAMKLSCTPNARRRSRGEPDSEPAHAATPDLPFIRSLNFGEHKTPQWGQDPDTPSPFNASLMGQSREQPRLPVLTERYPSNDSSEVQRPVNRTLAFDAFPALPRELISIPPTTRFPSGQPEREPQGEEGLTRLLDASFTWSPSKLSQNEETKGFDDYRKRSDALSSHRSRSGSFQQETLDQLPEPSTTRTDVCNGAEWDPKDAFQMKDESLPLSEMTCGTQEDDGGKVVPRRRHHQRPSMRWSEIACKSRELSRHNSLETGMSIQRSLSRNSFGISRTFSTDMSLMRQPSFESSIGPGLDSMSVDGSMAGDYMLEEYRQPPTPSHQQPQPRQVNRTASFVAMESGLAPAAGDEPRLATLVRSTSSVPSGSPVSFPANSPYCTPRGVQARSRLLRSPPEVDRLGVAPEDELLRGDDNDCRFEREFEERSKVGEGHFSTVWKAKHSVDSCWYAIKRTKQRIVAPGQKPNHRAVREAFALASVEAGGEPSPNIVRYYSSWFESGQLFIQMELCDGSLRDHLKTLQDERSDPRCTDTEIVEIIAQVANGLNCMHRLQFVHLDIKPDNIMRSRSKTANKWKIGDLGLAEIALSGHDDICEGDCRYLAREVLNGDFSCPTAADVFSLGLMAYEVGTNPRPLPGCGEEWHILREGILDPTFLPNMPPALWDLLQHLVRPWAWERPKCDQILEHPAIRRPKMEKELSVEDFERLREELEASKNTDIEHLVQQLQAAEERARRYKQEAAAAAAEAASFREQLAAQAAVLNLSKASEKPAGAVVSRRPSYMRRNTM
nr:Wee1 [Crypthecodinium cohnii]